MSVQVEHEHWFVDHEDPRWLLCDCGQYAVRTRNIAGDRILRLIDPPKPVFFRPVAPCTGESALPCPTGTADVDARERDLV